MPDFTYEALASGGKRDRGTLTANSEREAITVLDSRGLFPVRIEPVKSAAAASKGGKRLKSRYLAQLFGQLADLLRAGVPLLRAIDTLQRQTSYPTLKEILREVHDEVADGTNLADALNQHPRAFNELVVSMVRAGQEGGFLEDVLERVAQFTEQQEDLKSKVVGAMAYPVFLGVAGFTVLNILVIFFVPLFEPIFEKLAELGQLPALTQLLIGTSHLFQNNWVAVVIVICFTVMLPFFSARDFDAINPGSTAKRDVPAAIRATLMLIAVVMPLVLFFKEQYTLAVITVGIMAGLYQLKTWMGSDEGRFTLDRWRLAMPAAGKIYLHLALSRFTRILGTMLNNGIPILQSLRIAKDSTGNRVLTLAIDKAADNIARGEKLAVPLAACPYFPRDVVEMVAVGEESNQLEKVLLDIANALEKRTSRQLELFVRLLEPLMLLVMAAATMVVVMGLILPIFKIGSAVK